MKDVLSSQRETDKQTDRRVKDGGGRLEQINQANRGQE